MGLRLYTTKTTIHFPLFKAHECQIGAKKKKKSLIYSHMVHRTSCLSFGKLTSNTLDKLQFHSSWDKTRQCISLYMLLIIHSKQSIFTIPVLMYSTKLTSCSQILTITFAVAVSLWFPAQDRQTVKYKPHSVLNQTLKEKKQQLTSVINNAVV